MSEKTKIKQRIDETENGRIEGILTELKCLVENQDKKFDEMNQKISSEFQSIKGKQREVVIEDMEVVDPEDPYPIQQIVGSPVPMKSFSMKHTFKKVLNLKDGESIYSQIEEYFGIGWKLKVYREADHLGCSVYCAEPLENGKRAIETEFEVTAQSTDIPVSNARAKVFFQKGIGWGWYQFLKWKDLEEKFAVNGDLTLECHMEIKRMFGVYKDHLREFDERMEEFSDVVINVNNRKFYVLSKFLAAQSPYFKTIFSGRCNESSQPEIKLTGVDSDDFQNYLEVLYGESAIDEYTVEGILCIAEMYPTPIVTKKCEEFLLDHSKKTLRKKLEMASSYQLSQLGKQCLSEVRTVEDIRSVIPGDIFNLDPSLAYALLEKSISIE